MSEARINRRKGKPMSPTEGDNARSEALKDATPDSEPPWRIKTMKGKNPKGTADDESR